jgi:hypothetical protein
MTNAEKYPHYFKDVKHLDSIDVYRVAALWNVTNNAQFHALKKVLCAGGRGAKDVKQDIKEARDALNRWEAMLTEDDNVAAMLFVPQQCDVDMCTGEDRVPSLIQVRIVNPRGQEPATMQIAAYGKAPPGFKWTTIGDLFRIGPNDPKPRTPLFDEWYPTEGGCTA